MTPEASDPSMAGTSLIDYITTHFECFVKARPLLHCNATGLTWRRRVTG